MPYNESSSEQAFTPYLQATFSSKPVSEPKEKYFTENLTYVEELSISDFLSFLKEGHSFVPGKLKEDRKKSEAFESGNLICLDFDNGWSLERAISAFQNNAIAIYTTKSHRKPKGISPACDRYRVLLVLPFIATRTVYGLILKLLHELYPCDQSCKDLARGYLTYENSEIIKFDTNNRLDVCQLLKSKEIQRNFRETIKKEIKLRKEFKSELDFYKELYKQTKFWPSYYRFYSGVVRNSVLSTNSYSINIEVGKKGLNFLKEVKETPLPSDAAKKRYHKIRNFNFEFVYKNCRLLPIAHNSSHDELFHIATNLAHVEGGKTEFTMISKERAESMKKDVTKSSNMFSDIVKREYKPSNCSSFCRFHKSGECTNQGNLITLENEERLQIKKLKLERKLITLEEARTKLKEIFETTVQSGFSNAIHIIKAPTGTGKSTLLNSIQETGRRQVIVCPRNELLDGIESGTKYPVLDPILEKKVKIYTDHGISHSSIVARPELMKEIFTESEVEKYKDFFKDRKEALNSNPLRITHERLLIDPNIHALLDDSVIFIDEDIMDSLNKIESVSIDSVLRFIGIIEKSNGFSQLKDHLMNIISSERGKVIPTEGFFLGEDEVRSLNGKILNSIQFRKRNQVNLPNFNIYNFLNMDYFYVCDKRQKVHFVRERTLPSNAKIIILSATPEINSYKKKFGERVNFHSVGEIKTKAKLTQFNSRSFSRTAMADEKCKKKADSIVEVLKKKGWKVISYKKFEEEYKLDSNFYSSEGKNSLSGQNLLVVGTPNMNVIHLMLKSAALGYDYESIADYHEVGSEKIEFDGFEFPIKPLSKDPNILELQLHHTQKHLLQVVGRARYLENDCNVVLFSNFPLYEFEQNPEKNFELILNQIRSMGNTDDSLKEAC
ncbi:hypothetical protein LFX25_03685 [Leptospira sp. FAT2]|uniref:hypothetical protein n=1 Tax=Leptospira sanjuanensis TaxID=2879643 RepID=UPI001EE81143|nr:hypothetical protein [Leptospira sanjuanensis]MCG6192340.1 hypothetical protein [Leptospira sanjuanensis]